MVQAVSVTRVSEPMLFATSGAEEIPSDLRTGLPNVGDPIATEAVPVFCWHGISGGTLPSSTRVSRARFAAQLQGLADAQAQPLTLEDYDRQRGLRPVGSRQCLLVFDDGYESVLHHAFPLLAERGWTATVFPVLDFIGQRARWDPAAWLHAPRHLDRRQLNTLLDAGWQLGLHGRSHRPLDRCGLEVLDAELVSARADLELEFGLLIRVISWPWGLSDRRARRLAEAAGLHLGLGRAGSADPMDRPRRMIYGSHGPRAMARMLAGAEEDFRQRLAALGAGLSAELARRSSDGNRSTAQNSMQAIGSESLDR